MERLLILPLKANIPDQKADLYLSVSTNDATTGLPMGEISDSKNMDDFDTTTVAGAMEYIIAYADQHYGCPVMFYTGTKYDSEQYGEMVELTKKLQENGALASLICGMIWMQTYRNIIIIWQMAFIQTVPAIWTGGHHSLNRKLKNIWT